MAQKTKQTLKSYFETGDIPTQGNYVNLIDSLAVLQNDHNSGSLTLSGSLYVSGSSYINGNITTSGNISSSGDLIISSSLTFGAAAAEIISPTQLRIIGSNANDYMTLANDAIQISIDGSEVIGVTPTSIVLNASNQDIDFKANHDNGVNAIWTDASTNRVKLRDYVSIGSGSVENADPNALLVTGTTHFKGNVTASGNISASGTVTANEANITGHITASGNISASGTIYANNFQSAGGDVAGISFTDDLVLTGHLTASGNISASITSTGSFGSMILSNLPTTRPTISGSLWCSGSAGEGSKYLVVFTGI